MKKIFLILLSVLMATTIFTGCGNIEETPKESGGLKDIITRDEGTATVTIHSANSSFVITIENNEEFKNTEDTIMMNDINSKDTAFITGVISAAKSRMGWNGTYKCEELNKESFIVIAPTSDDNPENMKVSTSVNKSGFGVSGNKYKKVAFGSKELRITEMKEMSKIIVSTRVNGEALVGNFGIHINTQNTSDITIKEIAENKFEVTSTEALSSIIAQFSFTTNNDETASNKLKTECNEASNKYIITINSDSITIETK